MSKPFAKSLEGKRLYALCSRNTGIYDPKRIGEVKFQMVGTKEDCRLSEQALDETEWNSWLFPVPEVKEGA